MPVDKMTLLKDIDRPDKHEHTVKYMKIQRTKLFITNAKVHFFAFVGYCIGLLGFITLVVSSIVIAQSTITSTTIQTQKELIEMQEKLIKVLKNEG